MDAAAQCGRSQSYGECSPGHETREADLTFAAPLDAGSRSECQIQSSTRANTCQWSFDSDIRSLPKRYANVRIGPLVRAAHCDATRLPGHGMLRCTKQPRIVP